MFVPKQDWIVQNSITTGLGDIELTDTPPVGTSYFPFRRRFADGATVPVYWVTNNNPTAKGTKWESYRKETLTYGPPLDKLSRNNIDSSTNTDGPVNWQADDLPLLVYIVPDAAAAHFAVTMGLGATRPDVLEYGLWADKDGVSADVDQINFFDGTQEIRIGAVDRAKHKFTLDYMPVGALLPYVGTTAPVGFVLASGRTIGDASSAATERANADTEALFTLLWNSMANSEAAVSGGRGANAADDFAAHKTIALPDLRGRVVAGQDDMGGTSANRLTFPINGDTLGAAGGAETHDHTMNFNTSTTIGGAVGVSFGTDFTGNSFLHQHNVAGNTSFDTTVQPTLVLNYIIRL